MATSADVEEAGMSREQQYARPSSPLTRIQEKLDLQNLNDRLAAYIDRVRCLESENSRLIVQSQTAQKSITSTKSMYEQELAETRKMLDDTAKEKARFQIDACKWKNETEELESKFIKKEKVCLAVEKRLHELETSQSDLQTRVNQAVADKKRAEDEWKEATAERDKLEMELAETKAQLQDETLKRIDLVNRMQTLKEELAFRQNVHENEMSETRNRKQTEIPEVHYCLEDHYEPQMADTLKELRDQCQLQMRLDMKEMKAMYDSKVNDLQNNLDQIEAENTYNQGRVRKMDVMLEQERNCHLTVMKEKEEVMRELRAQIDRYICDYQDLMSVKVALDLEIAAYRKLLEREEHRLNITQVQSPSVPDVVRSTPARQGLKRKRLVDEDIEVYEHDHEGKYVTLYNKGYNDVALGGWKLVQQAGDQEIQFTFHGSAVIKGHAYVTVWSSSSGTIHNPPHDIVMEEQTWFIGNSIVTKLVDINGAMAVRKTSKVVEGTRDTASQSQPCVEEFYHQHTWQINPHERCSIM